jgi:hypothetical protein
VAGCATAVRRFLAASAGGAIVNVSSHQAQRPVRGALPYATAKAAVEGLSRALAVDYGPRGIGVNAVALGTIATVRLQALLANGGPSAAGAREQIRVLHPLGRPGHQGEAADAVRYLLSDEASFINGTVLPSMADGPPLPGPRAGSPTAHSPTPRQSRYVTATMQPNTPATLRDVPVAGVPGERWRLWSTVLQWIAGSSG